MRDRRMFFLLRMAFWLTIVLALRFAPRGLIPEVLGVARKRVDGGQKESPG